MTFHKTTVAVGAAALIAGATLMAVISRDSVVEAPAFAGTGFTSPNRNYDGIQHERVRKIIDPLYNAVHDELSDAYYNSKPFRTYGILTKEQFDTLQASLWAYYEIRLAAENQKQPAKDRYADLDATIEENGTPAKKSDKATLKLNQYKLQGYELTF